MDHNIRDRGDFYEKFDNFFEMLVGFVQKDNTSFYFATLEAISGLLGNYMQTQFYKREIKNQQFLILAFKQRIDIDMMKSSPKEGLHVLSGYVSKIQSYGKIQSAIQAAKTDVMVKRGVEFVFIQCPTLARTGTAEQYSEYIEKIFPDSKMKEIVYNKSNNRYDTFDERNIVVGPVGTGYYFSIRPNGSSANHLIPAIIDIRKPLKQLRHNLFSFGKPIDERWGRPDKIKIDLEALYKEVDPTDKFFREVLSRIGKRTIMPIAELSAIFSESIKSLGYDSLVEHLSIYTSDEIVIFEPEQIHVLGSKLDIEMFKDYVKKQKVNTRTGLTA